jgi:hypothetical protein
MTSATGEPDQTQPTLPDSGLSNAEIADRLAGLAQLLSTPKENPYKIKAYMRAAAKIRTLSESVDELVRDHADLTAYAGIGDTIAGAIQEIVMTGTLGNSKNYVRRRAPNSRVSVLSPDSTPNGFSVFIRNLDSVRLKNFVSGSKMARSKNTWGYA